MSRHSENPAPIERELPPFADVGVALVTKEGASACEDSVVADEHLGLFAVADGVGGEKGGGTASVVVTDNLHRTYTSSTKPRGARRLAEAVDAGIRALREQPVVPALANMGTTLTAVAAETNRDGSIDLAIAHVGDSRAYLYRVATGTLERLTTDDGYIELLTSVGVLPPKMALAIDQSANRGMDVPDHPALKSRKTLEAAIANAIPRSEQDSIDLSRLRDILVQSEQSLPRGVANTGATILFNARNNVRRVLNARTTRPIDLLTVSAVRGDVLVVCTDGLSDPSIDEEIACVVREALARKKTAQTTAEDLVDAAGRTKNLRRKADDRGVVVTIF